MTQLPGSIKNLISQSEYLNNIPKIEIRFFSIIYSGLGGDGESVQSNMGSKNSKQILTPMEPGLVLHPYSEHQVKEYLVHTIFTKF